ncbi:2-oxo acid dehydrogenase subunit E2 [Desulfobulbus rhabdoformis]|uniref:2-oxo acid dehydrogenase subunit E2 n=1 Tax=Desulfobulbus rhabdoformis TaxID=34032 RepID=UPI0019624B8A|nr:2-oxo acid dehydrogenase subunit E2 [Desulfobulbus rhabdoformis]MBM9613208.1 2-oxo acid dehydrogenase subunit E2 [Desulfobulbus rhabdoformis]
MTHKASLRKQFCDLWKQPQAPGQITLYPRMRNAILDIMAEGRRKNIINLLIQPDVSLLCQELERLRSQNESDKPTLTACVAHVFAGCIDADRSLQAYRLGRKKLVIFDEVDLAMMVEREVENQLLPVVYIIRGANTKSLAEIDHSLRQAKTTPLGTHGPLSRLEYFFFTLPRFLRRLVWWYLRRDPYSFKQLAGTVGITSMGMHTQGSAVVIPITPMSLTLSIGSLEQGWQVIDGQPVQRQLLQCNIGADHDVIDGAPLMRFAERFRQALEQGLPLCSSK